MEVTKVPVYEALKGCEISAQKGFLILKSDLVSYCSFAPLGRKMKATERKLMLQLSSVKHLKQFTISNC